MLPCTRSCPFTLELLGRNCVGLFLGWDDVQPTVAQNNRSKGLPRNVAATGSFQSYRRSIVFIRCRFRCTRRRRWCILRSHHRWWICEYRVAIINYKSQSIRNPNFMKTANCAGQDVAMLAKASTFASEIIGKYSHRLASDLRSHILAVSTGVWWNRYTRSNWLFVLLLGPFSHFKNQTWCQS